MLMAPLFLPDDERLTSIDPWLASHKEDLLKRSTHVKRYAERILDGKDITDFASGHEYFGLHRDDEGWTYRDWAPNATRLYLVGGFSDWKEDERFELSRADDGTWHAWWPLDILGHGDHYKLIVHWDGGKGERIPAWARYVVQDPNTNLFDAVVWDPPVAYAWHDSGFKPSGPPLLVYEAHIGMAGKKHGVSSYLEFMKDVMPRIKSAGYDTIQLMAIAEHPYYGSFGYHVSNFFAPSSRFGTPDELKMLVDMAHRTGLRVIMDIVHSHAVKNELEGISRYDGSLSQFFHQGDRGNHDHWDSRVFDYGKPEVAHFLLSNCRYWLDEFHIDGFRFDGVTSMLYTHHGMGKAFESYDDYFTETDDDALAYLTLANMLIHDVKPDAVTIAEDMSGMPGLAMSVADGGVGFDYRLSMGVPDIWIKHIKEIPDEDWKVTHLFHELTTHRPEEATISYAESHDQALVGDKTIMFRLTNSAIYDHMSVSDPDLVIDRGVALHKMIRLLTAATNSGGYLNFMGNEFGHPEWIDFPREGNDWSYLYARRQWNLVDDSTLKYKFLGAFDKSMVEIIGAAIGDISDVHTHDDDHVVAFTRGDYVFVFNFHPEKSFEGYHVPAQSGEYELVLSSDDKRFGGFGRIDDALTYPSDTVMKLYLPARTALVLKRLAR